MKTQKNDDVSLKKHLILVIKDSGPYLETRSSSLKV